MEKEEARGMRIASFTARFKYAWCTWRRRDRHASERAGRALLD